MKNEKISPHVIGQLINVSGRQRMLSQRISFFINLVSIDLKEKNKEFQDHLNLLEESINLFKESHIKLTSGAPGLFSRELHEIFHNTNDNNFNRINTFIENCEKVLKEFKKKQVPKDSIVLKIKNESRYPILKSLNEIVSVYERESKIISDSIEAEREERNLKLENMVMQLQEQESILKLQKEELKDLNQNLEDKVLIRTNELQNEKNKINSILDSIDQGIITINSSFKIDDTISKKTSEILSLTSKDIIGNNLINLLKNISNMSNEKIEFIKSCFTTCFNEELWTWDLNKNLLPSEAIIKCNDKNKYIILEWAPIVDHENLIRNITITIKDITKQKEFEEEQSRQNEKIEILKNIVQAGQNKISSFIERSMKTIQSFDDDLIDGFNIQTAKKLHSVKGEARILGLGKISELTHHCEDQLNQDQTVDKIEFTNGVKNIIKILNAYEAVLVEYFNDAQKYKASGLNDLLGIHIANFHNRLYKENIPISSINIQDNFINWNESILELFNEVFLHILNNSADHGYIFPIKEGSKIIEAKIEIKTFIQDNDVIIEYSDNGNGINTNKISKKLKREITEEEAYQLIFEPNLSTADSVTLTSGRGVGLSQIRDIIHQFKGNIKASKNNEQGLKIMIALPKEKVSKVKHYKNVA